MTCVLCACAAPAAPPASPRADAPANAETDGPLADTIEASAERACLGAVHVYGTMPPRSDAALASEGPEELELRRAGPLGTGTLVAPSLVATARHAIERAHSLRVRLGDGRDFAATVAGVDPDNDLALLRLTSAPGDLRPVPLAAPTSLQRGRILLVAGDSLGRGCSTSMGVVTGLTAPNGGAEDALVAIDANIHFQNNGGPVVDLGGLLVGIADARVSDRFAPDGEGYAIAIGPLRALIASVERDGKGGAVALEPRQHPTALRGILAVDLEPSARARYGIRDEVAYGAVVSHVEPNTPAERMGIEPGDVLVEVETLPMLNAEALQHAQAIEGALPVMVVRGNQAFFLLLQP